MNEHWRNPDGSVNYQAYIESQEWRRFREGYWQRHPQARCVRCAMSNPAHREKFATRLHLHHKIYSAIGQETDDDLEPICKPCHDSEHSGTVTLDWSTSQFVEQNALPEKDWEPVALHKISIRRRTVARRFANQEAELWKQLAWLSKLEDYVRNCQDLSEQGR